MKVVPIVILALLSMAAVFSPEAAPADEPPSKVVPSAVEWVDADGGLLALRLSVSAQTVTKGVPVKITAQIRNTGKMPVTVLRPFGDWYHAKASGIKIWDDKRRIRYSGPTPGYVIGADAFAVLAPGATIENHIELTTDNFAGIETPGSYTLRYDYSYDGCWDETAAAGKSGIRSAWRGTITSREVRVTRR